MSVAASTQLSKHNGITCITSVTLLREVMDVTEVMPRLTGALRALPFAAPASTFAARPILENQTSGATERRPIG